MLFPAVIKCCANNHLQKQGRSVKLSIIPMSLKILNSLSGEKEFFAPLIAGQARMYVCGVTVYDSAHLGHCRFLLTFDVIYRYLRFCGFDVTYVRNFTDVDDKIIRRAHEEQVSCDAITERYIAEFERDSDGARDC